MIRIGIDLSMNSCGITIINDLNNTIEYSTTHHFIKRNMDLLTYQECKALVEHLSEFTMKKTSGCEISVYIELGNYGNAAMTQKFGILAGMLITCFSERVAKSKYYLHEAKMISPNEWFKKFVKDKKISKPYNQLTREQRKQLSMLHSGIKQDDISDAYWVAIYGDKCKGMYE